MDTSSTDTCWFFLSFSTYMRYLFLSFRIHSLSASFAPSAYLSALSLPRWPFC
jgi:hypothetical protein